MTYSKVLSRCPICKLWSYGYYHKTAKLPKPVEYFPYEFHWQVGECCGYDTWLSNAIAYCVVRILLFFKDRQMLRLINQSKARALAAPDGQD